MKNLFLLLLMLTSAISYSHVDCTTISFVSAEQNEIAITLPTSNDCNLPSYEITQSNGGAFTPSTFSFNPQTGIAFISNLDPCTNYRFRILVFCCDEVVGGCQTLTFKTDCPECDCINYSEIGIIEQKECEAILAMGFNSGSCGEIKIVDATWDFGHTGGTGSGEVVTHTFPGNGTYTVSGTLTYEIVATGEICEETRSTEVVITDCVNPCDCINFSSVAVIAQKGCKAELAMGFNSGSCGEIKIVDATWDFGHTGGTGSGEVVTHTFPGNGTYTVSGTLTFEIVATGEICEETRSTEVVITDCVNPCDCINFSSVAVIAQKGCKAELAMGFNSGSCGEIRIVDATWDFGHTGGTGSGEVVTHTFPGNGTYTVSGTLTFEIVATGEICEETRSTEVVITDCVNPCDCINYSEVAIIAQKQCKVELVMSFNSGECGAIRILDATWDFGYPSGTGSGEVVTHIFPGNGTYVVSGTLTFEILATGEICEQTRSTVIQINNCQANARNTESSSINILNNPASPLTDLNAKPNPFNNFVAFSFRLTNDELVKIDIMNIQGKLLFTKEAKFNKGNNNVQLDLSNLTSGIYFYTIITNGEKKSGKLIKK